MLVLVASLIALLSPLVVGRWPAALVLHRWRWAPLVWATLVLQVVVVEVALPGAAAPVLHVVTYVVAVAFLVVNRSLRGTLLVAAGAVSNGVTIALNGGVLPATAAAVAAADAGLDPEFANSAVLAHPVLPWLGDVLAWPAPLPLANTVSVGDLLVVAGAAVVAWSGSRRIGAATSPAGGTAATDA